MPRSRCKKCTKALLYICRNGDFSARTNSVKNGVVHRTGSWLSERRSADLAQMSFRSKSHGHSQVCRLSPRRRPLNPKRDRPIPSFGQQMHPDLPGKTIFFGYSDRTTPDQKYLGGVIVATKTCRSPAQNEVAIITCGSRGIEDFGPMIVSSRLPKPATFAVPTYFTIASANARLQPEDSFI